MSTPLLDRLQTPGVHIVVGFDTTGLKANAGDFPVALALVPLEGPPWASFIRVPDAAADEVYGRAGVQAAFAVNRLTAQRIQTEGHNADEVARAVAQALAGGATIPTLWGFPDTFQAPFMGALLAHAQDDAAVQRLLGGCEIHCASKVLMDAVGMVAKRAAVTRFTPILGELGVEVEPDDNELRCTHRARLVAALLRALRADPAGFRAAADACRGIA